MIEGFPVLQSAVLEAAKRLANLENPTILCHLDADGLSSGAILSKTLDIMNKPHKIFPIRQLDAETIAPLADGCDFVLADLGSGQLPLLASVLKTSQKGVIIDHHEPTGDAPEGVFHLNALTCGFSGAREISGSGLAYFVAQQLTKEPALTPLGIVGAVGDLQAQGGLIGLNRHILADGISNGSVLAKQGLPFFGRETRRLDVFLSYASDPFLPELTGNTANCLEFLSKIGINSEQTYGSLPHSSLSKLITALHEHAISTGVLPWQVKKLICEYYIFPSEKEGTETRDATEFSTLLNACGRNEEAQIALEICKGDRAAQFRNARTILARHRENLRRGIEELQEKGTLPVGKYSQVFFSERTKPTIIGIVAGMALGGRLIDPSRIILAGAVQDERTWKVSARATPEMVRAGLNLAPLLRESAAKLGGLGGGHDIAGGASIPAGTLGEFAELIDNGVATQVEGSRRTIE